MIEVLAGHFVIFNALIVVVVAAAAAAAGVIVVDIINFVIYFYLITF